MSYLIIFSISPVQSFISQARKTGDLFAGSRILSEVSKVAVKLIKENSKEVLFPEGDEFLPNRIVAVVEDEPEKVCENANKEANDRFKELIKTDKNIDSEIFENQIKNFLRINYVAVPLDGKKYHEVYIEAEKYLGAVKNSGEFEKFVEEGGKKCSLCGERNVVIYRKTEKGKDLSFLIKEAVEVKKESENNLKHGEGLCAVCAGKRLNSQNESFPSTVYFSLLSKMKPEEIKQKETKLEDIQKIYETKEGRSLPKYYALLHFDGDSMGKWLSGENLKNIDELHDFHKKLSTQLSEFAKCAKGVVDANDAGRTVYSGGDDFLGFVTLEKLQDVLKYLEYCFDCKVNSELETFIKDGKKLTFSTSVVIAHYKTPLNKVLDYARSTLDEVKKRFRKSGKNGIVLTYITKSNSITTAFMKKDKMEPFFKAVDKLKDDKGPSSNFIYTFAEEFRKFDLESKTFDEYWTLRKMMETELKRLLERSWSGKDNKDREVLLEKLLLILLEQTVEHSSNCYSIDLNNFIETLMIADKLSAGGGND